MHARGSGDFEKLDEAKKSFLRIHLYIQKLVGSPASYIKRGGWGVGGRSDKHPHHDCFNNDAAEIPPV